jgi:hypothetical protein
MSRFDPKRTLPPPTRSSSGCRKLEALSQDPRTWFSVLMEDCLCPLTSQKLAQRPHKELDFSHGESVHADVVRQNACRRRTKRLASMAGLWVVGAPRMGPRLPKLEDHPMAKSHFVDEPRSRAHQASASTKGDSQKHKIDNAETADAQQECRSLSRPSQDRSCKDQTTSVPGPAHFEAPNSKSDLVGSGSKNIAAIPKGGQSSSR